MVCYSSLIKLKLFREQSFEISVGALKIVELAAFDRQLMGKHDSIGMATFKLDRRHFADSPIRDVLLPLSPRGTVHLRIRMEGGERHDVVYHLSSASRALDRAIGDMQREIVDKIGDFIRSSLSVATLQGLTKPLREKKRVKSALTDADLEGSLGPLFEYLNLNVSFKPQLAFRSTNIRQYSSPSFLLL